MRKHITKSLLPMLLLIGLCSADGTTQGKDEKKPAEPAANKEQAASHREAYDALYSEILKTLPKDGQAKMDSIRGLGAQADPKTDAKSLNNDAAQKAFAEKRAQEMSELPPAVKARVDKVLSDLDNRRKEKETEFKELK